MSDSTVIIETIESLVLKNNPLGDPSVRRVPVYLPPDYDQSKDRFPTVYVLTGFTGRGTMLLNDSTWDENIPQRMDRLIASGKVKPIILVMPDCFTRIGGSQYINSSATGNYEDHVVKELVPYFDKKYRTVADRDHRAVMGKSSGGYGAVILAMRNPQVFGLFASHSGDMYFELGYKPDFIGYLRSIKKYGGLKKFLETFPTIRPKDRDFGATLNTIAMAACYSPNPSSTQGFDLPFDEETGELRDDVWKRWLDWDPVYLVDKYRDALKSLKLIYLDAGSRDEFNLQFGARLLVKRLKEHGIKYIHEEFDDGHMNIPYRYDNSLKAISDAL